LDFTGCQATQQSTDKIIFLVVGGPVSWESKCQDTITLLTVEAEYIGFSHTVTQTLWLTKFFKEIGLPIAKPTIINADNTDAISNCLNNKSHCRTKHIDI